MTALTEAAWLDSLTKHANPTCFENVADAVDDFKAATSAEPCSLRIWLAYCEFLAALQEKSQSWEEDERLVCEEVFNEETIQETWDAALAQTKYRINDSHILWNLWMSQQIAKPSSTPQTICQHFKDRLQIPSAAWDETSSQYSSYFSQNLQDLQQTYEDAMVEVTALAKTAKSQYQARERWELHFNTCADASARKEHYAAYLQFESKQTRQEQKGNALHVTLYERAVLEFPEESDFWEEYSITINSDKQSQLQILKRAVEHCPKSQALWSRYLVCAEICEYDTADMQTIMEQAVQPQNLSSLAEAMLTYSTWCTYLRRSLAEEDVVKGIQAAIESVKQLGQLDPTFSLERLLIESFTASGDLDRARQLWNSVSKTHGASYDFWQQYAEWESLVPNESDDSSRVKAVLERALKNPHLDWPEKIIEVYNRYYTLHADVESLMAAKDFMYKSQKLLNRRRQREAAAVYGEQQASIAQENEPQLLMSVESESHSKRKREDSTDSGNKKVKSDHDMDGVEVALSPAPSTADGEPKRDREHLSLLVTNLPHDVTLTRIKKFFSGYGKIQEPIQLIKGEAEHNETSTALVEFRSQEHVASALLRNGRAFEEFGPIISVKPAADLTLYVTNFPNSEFGQDEFVYKMFGKYGTLFPPRWPDKEKRLMANLTRRFVYISYTTPEAAAAALELDQKQIVPEDNVYSRFTMTVKYSNPKIKKTRAPKKPREQPKPAHNGASSFDQEDTSMGGVEDNQQDGSAAVKVVEEVQAKPKPAALMSQPPIRRPAMSGPKKRGGFSRS